MLCIIVRKYDYKILPIRNTKYKLVDITGTDDGKKQCGFRLTKLIQVFSGLLIIVSWDLNDTCFRSLGSLLTAAAQAFVVAWDYVLEEFLKSTTTILKYSFCFLQLYTNRGDMGLILLHLDVRFQWEPYVKREHFWS